MPDPPIDTKHLPNFEAFRDYLAGNPSREAVDKWVDKLQTWCEQAHSELDGQGEQQKKIDALEREIMDMKDSTIELESLLDELKDVERGVTTFEELVERMRPIHA